VAVVVTRDPGPWFEESLASLGTQDYPNLEVFVVDNGSSDDPTPRVSAVLPDAAVKRLGGDRGFAGAADEAIRSVRGATFLLFLHDDVALPPDAVTVLVAEAFRANAGVVGPKLVDWDQPEVLRSVGLAVDAYGAWAELVDPGELDQSQHDLARNVFAVSSACMLVRSDLFEAIGGFSPEIPYFGEDVDLCWRTHAAGASVQFCPRVAVRHRGRFADRRDVDGERFALRHQARMVLVNDELRRALWRVPLALVLAVVDLVGSLLAGRFRRGADVVAALVWNTVHLPDAVRARRRLRRVRRAHDGEFQVLFHRGSHRLRSLVRDEEGQNRLAAATVTSRAYLRDLTSTSSRLAAALITATVVLALVGARHLFAGELPAIREFAVLGSGWSGVWADWWTAWRGVGLGESSVPPAFVPVSGALSMLLAGSVALARRLVVLGPLVVGAVGAWKLFVRSGSVRARAAALAVYALNPVALNAVATGRLQALVAYAAAPWLLRRVATRAGLAPFAAPLDRPGPLGRHLAGNALVLVAVGCLSPLGALIVAGAVAGFAVAPVVSGRRRAAARLAGYPFGGLLLAVPVLFPWLLEAVRRGDPASLTGLWAGRGVRPSAAELLTGSVGPVTVGLLGWGILVAAAVPLLTGRSWRLGWAVAGWVVASGSWAVAALLSGAGHVAGAGAELFLVPAVLGLLVSVAMGPFAFEEDVIGGDFGLPQVVSGIGVVALAVGLVPVAVAAADGRWYQPDGDFQRALSLVEEGDDFRTLWIGDPDVLPLAGWGLPGSGRLAVALSEGFEPTMAQRFRLDGGAGVATVREAVGAALSGRTARLGQLLAPMGVHYVLVIDRPAPPPFAPAEVPPPRGTVAALEEQLDLSRIPLAPGAALFRVSSPWPLRSDVTDLDLPADGAPSLADQLRLPPSSPPAVLGSGPGTSFRGRLADGDRIAQAVEADPNWHLTVDGNPAERTGLFGWGQQFTVDRDGPATLAWSTPWTARALQALQVAALAGLVFLAGRRRRLARVSRRRIERPTEPVVVVPPGAGGPVGDEAR
jgi:GT2 family glycosyltransferase